MFHLFLSSLSFRWFEYVLGALVIALPVATLTVQQSLAASTEEQIHELAHDLGKNMLVVPSETDLADFYTFEFDEAAMPEDYPRQIQASEVRSHIGSIQARLYGNVEVSDVPLVLVGERSFRRGRALAPAAAGEAVLGDEAARRLDLGTDGALAINDVELTVARVSETAPDGLNTGVFTGLDSAQGILNRPDDLNAMRLAGCWCRIDVQELASQVEGILPGTKAVTVSGLLAAQTGTIEAVQRYSKVTYAAAVLLIAAIAMIVVASQIRRQQREIGLVIAVGGRPWLVALVFVVGAGLMGTLGAGLGYLVGFPLTEYAAARFVGVALPVAEGTLPSLLGLALAVSLVAALIPALRAARLDPTEVLREV